MVEVVIQRMRLFQQAEKIRLSAYIWAIVWFMAVTGLVLNNGIYVFMSLATLLAIVGLLSFQRLPGILLFSLAMQWMQVFAFVVWMNFGGFDINFLSPMA